MTYKEARKGKNTFERLVIAQCLLMVRHHPEIEVNAMNSACSWYVAVAGSSYGRTGLIAVHYDVKAQRWDYATPFGYEDKIMLHD